MVSPLKISSCNEYYRFYLFPCNSHQTDFFFCNRFLLVIVIIKRTYTAVAIIYFSTIKSSQTAPWTTIIETKLLKRVRVLCLMAAVNYDYNTKLKG